MEQLSDVGLIGLGVEPDRARRGRRCCGAFCRRTCCRKANSGLFGLVRVCGIFEPTENYYDDGAGRQCSG